MTKILVERSALTEFPVHPNIAFAFFDPDFSLGPVTYKREDIINYINECNKKRITTAIIIDNIISEQDLPALKTALNEYIKCRVQYFIYSDFAVLSILKRNKIANQGIYDPKTLVTNYGDAKIHNAFGGLITPSCEVTWAELKDIITIGNSALEVYGHRRIFYSKRQLLSAYHIYHDNKSKNSFYEIKEELHPDTYYIYESVRGSAVYTKQRLHIFKELTELAVLPKFLRISGIFIPDEELQEITGIYCRFLENMKSVHFLYEELIGVSSDIKTGYFLEGAE